MFANFYRKQSYFQRLTRQIHVIQVEANKGVHLSVELRRRSLSKERDFNQDQDTLHWSTCSILVRTRLFFQQKGGNVQDIHFSLLSNL
jgi:hypothetical protein